MEKTFNLQKYFTKTANMSYEGSQGYFLAQQRAWMNCSKCKRVAGKTAQEAWQECFDEFQNGDRKLSWLENYAKEDVGKVSKESAVDYSEDIVKLSSSGMSVGAAVNKVLQTKLAWPSWMGGSNKDNQPNTANPPQNPATNTQSTTTNEPMGQHPDLSDAAMQARKQKSPNIGADRLAKEKATYDSLLKMKALVEQGEYDTNAIKGLITAIPFKNVQEYFAKYLQYLNNTERQFDAKIRKMVSDATKLMLFYEKGRKGFQGIEQQAPALKGTKPQRAAG